jgi:hypothetical protein
MDANRFDKYWPETPYHCSFIPRAWQRETAGLPTASPRAPRIHDLVVGSGRDRIGRWCATSYRFFTRPVAFIPSGDMAMGYFMAHASKSFFPLLNGGDGAILYCFIFLLFFVAGPGRWSIDAKVGGEF